MKANQFRRTLIAATALGSSIFPFLSSSNLALNDDVKHRTYATRGNGSDFHRFYRETDKKLGEGTFAVVKKGINLSSHDEVAIKEIDKQKSCEEARANEVMIMEKMGHHPNLIGLRNVYENDDILFVIQDLAEGGELFDRIVQKGELSESDAAKFFKQAVLAVKHLHDRHIVHLDIKPENLLLRKVEKEGVKRVTHSPNRKVLTEKDAEEVVALADFGLAVEDESDAFDLCVGTPAYWAPEMVRREPFTPSVDIWALGCVLYILLCGVHPFDPSGDAPEAQILARVSTGEYDKSSLEFKALSEGAKDLIRHLLDSNPSKRYTAQKILEHPWLTSELSQKPLRSNNVVKLRGFRVLTLIKTGMHDTLHQAESDLFDGLDVNKDGFISPNELATGLRSVGFDLNDAEIDAFLLLVDTDGDSMISREEFEELMAKRFDQDVATLMTHSSLEDLSVLFKAFDKNGDGYISPDDVHHVLCLLGSSTTKSVVHDEWSHATEDAEGRISFAEFVKHVRNLENDKMKTDAVTSGVLNVKDRRDLLKSRR